MSTQRWMSGLLVLACGGALGLAVACGGATPEPSTPAVEQPAAPAPAEPATEGPPAILHEVAGRDNCTSCHRLPGGTSEDPKAEKLPADHEGRDNSGCQGCHSPAM